MPFPSWESPHGRNNGHESRNHYLSFLNCSKPCLHSTICRVVVSFNDTSKVYAIVEPNTIKEYVVQYMANTCDSHTTYMEALEKVAYLIINDLKKAGGHTNGKT